MVTWPRYRREAGCRFEIRTRLCGVDGVDGVEEVEEVEVEGARAGATLPSLRA
jgi:hypothetical protein